MERVITMRGIRMLDVSPFLHMRDVLIRIAFIFDKSIDRDTYERQRDRLA